MNPTDEKLLGLGRMVFGMITDLAILPAGDAAFGRKTITMPDGSGGKTSVEIILARKQVADAMEEGARMRFGMVDIPAPEGHVV